MAPAVLFGKPDEFAAIVQYAPVLVDEARHVMRGGFLAIHVPHAAVFDVGEAQLGDLVIAGRGNEGEALAVGAPLRVEKNAAVARDVVARGRTMGIRRHVEEYNARFGL